MSMLFGLDGKSFPTQEAYGSRFIDQRFVVIEKDIVMAQQFAQHCLVIAGSGAISPHEVSWRRQLTRKILLLAKMP